MGMKMSLVHVGWELKITPSAQCVSFLRHDRWACGAALACALMLFYSAGAPEAAGQPAQFCHLNPAVRGLPPHCCAVAAGWQGRAYKPNLWCWSRVRTFFFRFQQTAFDRRQIFACWRACCSSTSSCSPRGGVHARAEQSAG